MIFKMLDLKYMNSLLKNRPILIMNYIEAKLNKTAVMLLSCCFTITIPN